MDQQKVGSGRNLENSTRVVHNRKHEKPQLILSSNQEVVQLPKRKFADEPRITGAILPPPAVTSNSTRLRINEEKKPEVTKKISPKDSSLNSNETLVEDGPTQSKSTIKPSSVRPPATTPKTANAGTNEDFGDVVSSVWKKMKQLMGFSPPCHNGGHKNLRGLCECPKYYEGELCEQVICINNGTKTRIKTMIPPVEVCKCPHPRFISGSHCEFIHCQNGGKDAGDGSCRCVDGWYTGQFCEFYASSWLAVVGVPLLCLAIIFLCCIVCRLDLCPRRSSRRDRERRRNHYGNYQMPRRTYANNRTQSQQLASQQNITEQARMMQENLLNDAAFRRSARSRSNEAPVSAPGVFRLERNPVFNPEIMNNSEYKLDAPPSYEQATRCPTIVQSNYHPNTNPATLPDYSPPRTTSQSHTPRQNSQLENG